MNIKPRPKFRRQQGPFLTVSKSANGRWYKFRTRSSSGNGMWSYHFIEEKGQSPKSYFESHYERECNSQSEHSRGFEYVRQYRIPVSVFSRKIENCESNLRYTQMRINALRTSVK